MNAPNKRKCFIGLDHQSDKSPYISPARLPISFSGKHRFGNSIIFFRMGLKYYKWEKNLTETSGQNNPCSYSIHHHENHIYKLRQNNEIPNCIVTLLEKE